MKNFRLQNKYQKVGFGLTEVAPKNFWTTFESSTILVLQSPEVTSTSDGLPGANCNMKRKKITSNTFHAYSL